VNGPCAEITIAAMQREKAANPIETILSVRRIAGGAAGW
jgi:hypothetical protein